MTAKEKAKEILDKHTQTLWDMGMRISKPAMRQSAIITARFIFLEYARNFTEDEIYWQNVINELEKL